MYRENFYPDGSYCGYELLKHSPLSETQKQNLKNAMENCEKDADLVYSGLASIKLHIEDYILYHHKRNQYNELQSIANSVFDLIQIHIAKKKDDLTHKTAEEIKANKEKTDQELNRLKEIVDNLKNVASNIEIQTSFIKRAATRIDHDFLEIKNKVFSKQEFSEQEAFKIWNEVNKIVENLSISINTAFKNKTTEVFNTMIKELKSTIANYFSDDNVNLDITFINKIMINEINSIAIEDLKKITKQRTDTGTVEVESKWWIKRFINIKVEKKFSITSKFITKDELHNVIIKPIASEFADNIEKFQNDLEKSRSETIDLFYEEINQLFIKARERIELSNRVKLQTNMGLRRTRLNRLENLETEYSNLIKIIV